MTWCWKRNELMFVWNLYILINMPQRNVYMAAKGIRETTNCFIYVLCVGRNALIINSSGLTWIRIHQLCSFGMYSNHTSNRRCFRVCSAPIATLLSTVHMRDKHLFWKSNFVHADANRDRRGVFHHLVRFPFLVLFGKHIISWVGGWWGSGYVSTTGRTVLVHHEDCPHIPWPAIINLH